MRRFISGFVIGVFGVLVAATSVLAADIALVIGNRNYQRASTMYDAETALNAAGKLRNSGYAVVSGRDLSIDQVRSAFRGFIDRFEAADRAVVLLNGHFVHSASDTWFVPSNAYPPNAVSINYEGLSVQRVLDIVAAKPGGAVVFLGTTARQISTSEGIEAGIGALNIPQGVLVITGTPAEIALTVQQDFLAAGVGFADALENAPDSVVGQGFVSNIGALVPVEAGSPGRGSFDDGYWQAVNDLGTERALRSYLAAYPRGNHAAEAHGLLAALEARSPLDEAKEAEAALALSRDARRKIQENLSLLGYDTRGIDGIFGRGSRAAVAKWQQDGGLDATGYLKRGQVVRLNRQAVARAEELALEAQRKQRELEDADRAFWQASGAASGNERGMRQYLQSYPDGLFADVAELRLQAIEDAKRQTVGAKERKVWDFAKDKNSVESYSTYLTRYPRGAFVDPAKARIEKLRKNGAKKAVIEAAKKEEVSLKLNGFGRTLVERQLISLGFDAGTPDGKFDADTRRALRRFQRARGFVVTGYLTRKTIVRLIAEAK